MLKKILALAFIVWVVLWLVFFLRELFYKANFRDYKILISRDLEGKRAYVTGDKFYEFLTLCKSSLPKGATYALDFLNENFDWSLYKRRAIYYMYPNVESEDPDFILVYDQTDFKKDGYAVYAKLGENSLMLKKERAK